MIQFLFTDIDILKYSNLDNKIKAQNNPTDINDLISGVYGVYACGAIENIKNLPELNSGVLVVFSNSAILDKIIKYAPKDYQVRSVVGDYVNRTTCILALSSNNKALIDIKIWQEIPKTTITGIHGTLIWIKS